jgi:hypothetical protein
MLALVVLGVITDAVWKKRRHPPPELAVSP